MCSFWTTNGVVHCCSCHSFLPWPQGQGLTSLPAETACEDKAPVARSSVNFYVNDLSPAARKKRKVSKHCFALKKKTFKTARGNRGSVALCIASSAAGGSSALVPVPVSKCSYRLPTAFRSTSSTNTLDSFIRSRMASNFQRRR